jgi:hypothetical protein
VDVARPAASSVAPSDASHKEAALSRPAPALASRRQSSRSSTAMLHPARRTRSSTPLSPAASAAGGGASDNEEPPASAAAETADAELVCELSPWELEVVSLPSGVAAAVASSLQTFEEAGVEGAASLSGCALAAAPEPGGVPLGAVHIEAVTHSWLAVATNTRFDVLPGLSQAQGRAAIDVIRELAEAAASATDPPSASAASDAEDTVSSAQAAVAAAAQSVSVPTAASAGPFLDAVDPAAPSYYTTVALPMHLGLILQVRRRIVAMHDVCFHVGGILTHTL